MTTNLSRLLPAALVAGLAVCSAGCLEKETRSTAYVEDDGTVTWVVVESEVRSDESNAEDARREESEHLSACRSGTAPVPEALAAIGGRDVRADVLRDRVPFETLSSARFSSLEHLARSFCDAAGWTCETATVTTASHTTWSWTVPVSPGRDDKSASPVDPLSDALSTLRVVVAGGRLIAARGFNLEGDRAAALIPPEDEKGETFTFSLTWERR